MGNYIQKRRLLHPVYSGDTYRCLESKYWLPPLTCVADGEDLKHFWPSREGVYTKEVSLVERPISLPSSSNRLTCSCETTIVLGPVRRIILL